MLKQFSIFHPFLFAIFPVLFLFAYNIDEIPATDLLLPMLVVIAITLILLFSLRLVTKSYNKIAIITSLFLILFFSYGYFRDLIRSSPTLQIGGFISDHNALILLLLWALIFTTGAFLIIKSRGNFLTLTKFLNVVAIALVAISLFNIGIYEIRTANLEGEKIDEEGYDINLNNPDNLPDIYYIILDTYERADTLMEAYNYDNSEFIDYLTDKGFYVATKSHSNYTITVLSMASSLNMEYLNYLSDTVGVESIDLSVPFQMIANNKVSQFLKSKGYHYIFIPTGYSPPDIRKYADVYKNISRISINNFSSYLIQTTALIPFVEHFILADARTTVLCGFDSLAHMPNLTEPTFVYAHISSPHPPYIFDRDGNPTDGEGTYIDQLIFTNKKMKAIVDEILLRSNIPPIIILQADTGHKAGSLNNILNAYYLPGKNKRLLYKTITPVNSFRIVFNLYFDTNHELLRDESYHSIYEHPYEFITIPLESDSN